MGIITDSIKEKLTIAFNPSQLEVIDESHLHAGHAGAAAHEAEGGGAESHIRVRLTAPSLADLSRLARHRAVQEAIEVEIAQIHAFALELDV